MIDGRRVRFYHYRIDEADIGEHGVFSYDSFRPDRDGEYVEPDDMGYSDYSGSTVSRANVEEFVERFAEYQGVEWWRLHGGHGTDAVVVRRDADERVPEIGEFFEDLANYPVANEDRLSRIEMEMRDEAWSRYGRLEFRNFLEDKLDEEDLKWWRHQLARVPQLGPLFDELDDEVLAQFIRTMGFDPDDEDADLSSLWHALMQNGSGDEEEITDASGSVHFQFDRAIGQAIRSDYAVDRGKWKVALDSIFDHGGEWTETAEKVLPTSLKYLR